MSKPRYPNESRKYRAARDALLKEERELVRKVKAVAAKRRKLPPGGELKEDWLLYSFMFGPNWDNPCPSCTSLVDGFDRTWYQVSRSAAFAAIAKAPPGEINAWARKRGWSQDPAAFRIRLDLPGGLQVPG